MWLFTRYGFYSIACASDPQGSIDSTTVMIRARCANHLERLKGRFPVIADAQVVLLPDRDYRYRLIIPKDVWVNVIAELAQEQEWSNFKNEAARYQGRGGPGYENALHEVWRVMYRLHENSDG